MKGKKRAQPFNRTHILWAIILVSTMLMMILMHSITSNMSHHNHELRWSSPASKTKIARWKFTTENIEKEPGLQDMLSNLLLNRNSLRSMTLKSPGISETTTLDFFGTNPGWLSKRTFTADVFLCPPNSHEGIYLLKFLENIA
jgi:hypothetical protein